jgi:hypothetical protein
LGLHLCWPDAREPIAIQDVQIWSDGGMTCRLCGQFTTSADAKRRSTSRPPTIQATKGLTTRCSGRGKQPPRR